EKEAWCGESSTLLADRKGLFLGNGSVLKTSKAAPAIRFLRSAFASADSSTSPPRAVLIRYAPGFILANCFLPISPRVSRVSDACKETKSLQASNRSNVTNRTPSFLASADGCG